MPGPIPQYVFLNGRLTAADRATVSVFDRGFAYGDSLFETIKVLAGRPVFFPEHLNRLAKGMELAGFKGKPDAAGLLNQALALAQRNEVKLGRLRIQVTRGTPERPAGPDPGDDIPLTWLMTLEPFTPLPAKQYQAGVACATVAASRGRYAALKSTGLLGSILARRQAHAAGAWEAVITSGHGRMLEGVYTNIFFLAGNLLVTAGEADGVLAGIIRGKVLKLAPGLDLAVEFHAPQLAELGLGATSAFLTSSLLGICAISEIDGIRLEPDPGAISLLRERLRVLEEESAGVPGL
ncbi:MAG: aminotransferase class IV [Thermoleophilia bacterium]